MTEVRDLILKRIGFAQSELRSIRVNRKDTDHASRICGLAQDEKNWLDQFVDGDGKRKYADHMEKGKAIHYVRLVAKNIIEHFQSSLSTLFDLLESTDGDHDFLQVAEVIDLQFTYTDCFLLFQTKNYMERFFDDPVGFRIGDLAAITSEEEIDDGSEDDGDTDGVEEVIPPDRFPTSAAAQDNKASPDESNTVATESTASPVKASIVDGEVGGGSELAVLIDVPLS